MVYNNERYQEALDKVTPSFILTGLKSIC